MASDRVDFIDENDAGCILLRLLEHVAHARGADADEHLDEVRTRDREERHIGFARDRARDQRLAGAGWADEQHAARTLAAEPLEFAGVAQEFDDLLQVLLGLVDARDILERHAAMRLGEQFRPRLAETHRLAGTALHLTRQEYPHADQRDKGEPRNQQRHEPRDVVALRTRRDLHALAVEPLHQGRIVRRVGVEGAAIRIVAVDLGSLDGHVADTAVIHLGQELRERNIRRGRARVRILEQREKGEQQKDDNHPEGEVAQVRVHPKSLEDLPDAKRHPAAC
jgi:hypothetical protein